MVQMVRQDRQRFLLLVLEQLSSGHLDFQDCVCLLTRLQLCLRSGVCYTFWRSGGQVMQIPFIEMLNERLRYELCVLLQPLPARIGDVIIRQGDYGDE